MSSENLLLAQNYRNRGRCCIRTYYIPYARDIIKQRPELILNDFVEMKESCMIGWIVRKSAIAEEEICTAQIEKILLD